MLSPAERKSLKARAHSLEPVVIIGGKGLTDEVLAEIDRALHAHELVKIRAAALEREERESALAAICEKTGAEPVQHIGKVLVLFRKSDEP
jgi:putative YhbY family RNA-binding protein